MNTAGGNAVLDSLIAKFETQIINPIITLLTLAAFVLFVWGIVQYIQNAADEEKRKQGVQNIIWGIVGLLVMFGAFAIVAILKNVVGVFA